MTRGPTRTEFERQVAAHAAELRQRIEAEASGIDPAPAAIAERRARTLAPDGFEAFCRTYFPHYIKWDPSAFHEDVYRRLPAVLAAGRSVHTVYAAPRGEAKSTLCGNLFPLWCLARKAKHFIILIADASHQAALQLEAIKAELASNPQLRVDVPELVGEGRVWQDGVVVTRTGAKLMAFGSGKRMRGLRHGAHRPDLVVLDDIENDDNVRSPEQRDRVEAWVDKAVLNLGAAGAKMDVVYVGTVLHYDSVLRRKLANPLWHGVVFQAVKRWPDRMDLWDRWEEVLRNHGEDAADRFHARHQAEMVRGARVSWPAARPIHALMKIRVRVGRHAFDTEFQNDPVSDDSAPFAKLGFWVERRRDWVFFGAVDPSLGRLNRSRDPSAILVGGFDKATGVLDVVHAEIRRVVPDLLIERIIALQLEFRCVRWAVEAVQFQEFLASEVVRRSAARQIPVPVVPVKPHADKALRIESLQPHVANGLIRVHQDHRTLIDQLRHWPKADHDDGPDALHMLWEIALSGAGPAGGIRGVPAAPGSARRAFGLGRFGWGERDDDDSVGRAGRRRPRGWGIW